MVRRGKLKPVENVALFEITEKLPRHHAEYGLYPPIMRIMDISDPVKKVGTVYAAPEQLP